MRISNTKHLTEKAQEKIDALVNDLIDSISATFSSDFNTVTIRDEEGSEVVCTRN